MSTNELIHVATGHRDCCGDMIYEGDTVVTRNGHGRAVWLEERWYLQFSDLSVEALNRYPAGELRRLVEDMTMGVVTPVVTESIVTVTKNDCHTHCPAIVPRITRSESIGYINNGTMGQ